MRRIIWIVPSAIAVALTGYLLGKPPANPIDPDRPGPAPSPLFQASQSKIVAKPADVPVAPNAVELPVTQIVLYSSGVGFFQREGYVNGDARVDLNFPVNDINDMLKSMVLQDLDGGRVNAVGYDSLDPLNKTLNGFAIQLTGNPSHAEILNQARGEKVEVTLGRKQPGDSSQNHATVATIQGTIIGVETKPSAGKDNPTIDILNLWCGDGMRSIPLCDAQRVKFLNPAVETEIAKALEVLARGHDSQKKAVSLQFNGNGARSVRVGYVVEAPLWRTSYRLLMDKEGKLFVQGWALVDNPTNDDWKNVRMSLVSGRPISFQMDLYQPIYVPRPVVQPELYGWLRPTTHNGAFSSGQFGAFGLTAEKALPAVAGAQAAAPAQQPYPNPGTQQKGATTYQPVVPGYTSSSRDNGPVNIGNGSPTTTAGFPFTNGSPLGNNAEASDIAAQRIAEQQLNFKHGVVAAATANDLGDAFQYAIDHPVTIPRQKSALLPIVNGGLEGDKVSLYSPSSHPKHPLLALRLKNTTGVHLMQGPVSVFEGTGYCGDAQLPDLQPNEERFVSYALDLGTEVAVRNKLSNDVLSIRIKKGLASVNRKVQVSKNYTMKNRSAHDRIVVVEHAYRPEYRVVSEVKPKERTRDLYRFEVKVAAGQTAELEVTEELDARQEEHVVHYDNDRIQALLLHDFSTAEGKSAFEKLLRMRKDQAKIQEEIGNTQRQFTEITADQQRLRANLKEMPETAAAYKRYLEKFDSQETTIERLQAQLQTLRERVQTTQQEYETYLNGLDLEITIRRPAAPK